MGGAEGGSLLSEKAEAIGTRAGQSTDPSFGVAVAPGTTTVYPRSGK